MAFAGPIALYVEKVLALEIESLAGLGIGIHSARAPTHEREPLEGDIGVQSLRLSPSDDDCRGIS